MSQLASVSGSQESIAVDEYDSQHGKATLADTQKLANISEGGNKAPPQYTPFKITVSK